MASAFSRPLPEPNWGRGGSETTAWDGIRIADNRVNAGDKRPEGYFIRVDGPSGAVDRPSFSSNVFEVLTPADIQDVNWTFAKALTIKFDFNSKLFLNKIRSLKIIKIVILE